MSGRSSRRQRRPPVRHPVPARRPGPAAAGGRGPAGAGPARAGELPASPLFQALLSQPVENAPLWAAVAVLHTELAGYPANICVTAGQLLVRTLGPLGFDAELMAACATVYRREDTSTVHADIGRWDRPPTVRPDGSTDGHAVVWAGAFGRLVDATVAQDPTLAAAGAADETMTRPVIIPVGDRDELLAGTHAAPRGPYLISWMLFPDWTSAFDPLITRGRALNEYAALQLTDRALHALRRAAEQRGELRALHSLYPRLGALLSGRTALPAMDPPPGAAPLGHP